MSRRVDSKVSKVSKVLVTLMAGLVLAQAPAQACGPFFESAVFDYSLHPCLPLSRFAGGDLGVVRPEFARSYKVVAYRYLIGKPLS
ncbi:MAG: hypothetical protein K8F91_12140, partial [Candidatus Obscuribacterales bacterium]|nr:hypothetical protein [Candidatus Obscuribacterales bacterium]